MNRLSSKTMILCAALVGGPALAGTPDPFVTTQAKLSLWTTDGLHTKAINIDTNNGVVTLYGKVPTAAQKALAEQATAKVKGVKEVRNLLQVVTDADMKRVERADKEIKESAEKMLKEDRLLQDSKISVKSVDKGVLLLSGKAATVSDHLRAVMMADAIPGVRRVATEVLAPDSFGNDERPYFTAAPKKAEPAAKSKAGEAKNDLDDMRISSAVKLRLWTTSNVPSTEINVDTNNRVVTLFGLVPTAESKAAAANEAAKVDGVAKVENQLQVVAPAKLEAVEAKDKDIEMNLKLSFKDRPELNGVVTEVRGGVVRLTGSVDSSWDKMNAMGLARFTKGVRGLEEQLVVKGEAERKGAF